MLLGSSRYLNFCLLPNPPGQRLSSKAYPLDVHCVCPLGLAFSRKVHDHRSSVQLELLEDVLGFIKVDQGEEQFVCVLLVVAE